MPLVLLTPGPKAPNDFTLNEIIDPLVDEMIELQKGKCHLTKQRSHTD